MKDQIRKRILSLVLVIAIFTSFVNFVRIPVKAATVDSGTCGTNLTWTLFDSGTLTISGTGAMTDYSSYAPWYSSRDIIKTVVMTNDVTTIGNKAFFDFVNLESVKISDSVTTIGNWAFYNCTKLTKIIIPSSATAIGSRAFYGCEALEDLTIGNSVSSIGESAFYSCDNLASVTIPDSVVTMGTNVFSNCQNLKSVTIGNSVTAIKANAFYSCANLESIIMGNSVTTIGNWAFSGCQKLKVIKIGDSVTSIGDRAFNRCTNLAVVTIPDSVASIGDNTFYDYNYNMIIRANSGSYAETYAKNNNIIFSVPSGICGDNATYTLGEDGSLLIEGTGALNEGAFSRWGIISLIISDGITEIDATSFGRCVNLENIWIGNDVKFVGDNPFRNCGTPKTLTVSEDNPNYSALDGILFNKDKTELIKAVGAIPSSYAVPDTVVTIAKKAFELKSELIELTIPDSVITIDDRAFYFCESLSSVTLGNSVETIGLEAFYECDALVSIVVPESVTSLGAYSLGYFALDYVELMYEIVPDFSIYGKRGTEAETYANNNGMNFIRIDMEEDTVVDSGMCGENAAWILSENGTLTLFGTGSVEKGSWDASIVNNVILESGITSIEPLCFDDENNIVSVTIPETVTNIGEGAFSGCTSLVDVYYEGSEYQWNIITVGLVNDALMKANLHFAKANNTKLEIIDNKVTVSEGIMKGLSENMTVSSLSSVICNDEFIVLNAEGAELSEMDKIGTGTFIAVMVDGVMTDSVTVVINGDVDGTGTVDSTDYLRIKSAFLNLHTLEGAYLAASDTNADGEINATDYLQIKSHFLGTYSLY